MKKKEIRQFMSTQFSYALHKPIPRPKVFRKTLAFHPRDLWQIDLLDLQKFNTENRDYNYLCVIIDCFSRFVWAKPLITKTGKSLVKALALLLMNERPKLLQADQGTEFFNKDVKLMLEAFTPKLYHTYSDRKATMVERVQRTLRLKLGRLFTKNGNNNWIDHIDDVIESYNNTYHRSIKMAPSEVKATKTANLFYSTVRVRTDEAKFKVGDKVLMFGKKKEFQKEYQEKWLTEIFKVKKVLKTIPVTYILEDEKGEEIDGSFYDTEIQHIKV